MADVNSRNLAENKDIAKLKLMKRHGAGVKMLVSNGSVAQYSVGPSSTYARISSFTSKKKLPSVQSSIRRKLDTCIVNNYEVSKKIMSKIDPIKFRLKED